MLEDVFRRYQEFLDAMPGGFPATESGVELKILARYFTPEEAELAMKLSRTPEPVASIAERLGMDADELASRLEKMAREGSLFRVRIGCEPHYSAQQFLVGIYEFHVDSLDRELAELLEEYIPHVTDAWGLIPTMQLRVIPVGAALDTTSRVAPYDVARELVKGQGTIAVAECICRKERALVGKSCDHPLENCLSFGYAAEYYIENGIGRRIAEDECLKLLDEAERIGMVVSPGNSQLIMNICICCGDSCGNLRALRSYERPADHAGSRFQASIDPDECTLCETCLERCQIEALVEGDECVEVDRARCIGCGLCVTTCPVEAITLIEKAEPPATPENFFDMQMRISQERGLQ